MNYNAEELCSMNLENLIHNSCKHKWSNLKRNFLQESSHLSPSNEKLVNIFGFELTLIRQLNKIIKSFLS